MLYIYAGTTQALPGGGTSLQFFSDTAIGIIPKFTALSEASNFTVELWYYPFMMDYAFFPFLVSGTDGSELLYAYVFRGVSMCLTSFGPVIYSLSA